MDTDNTIPPTAARLFAADERIVTVRHYEDGFVPNAYKYRAPGTYTEYTREGGVSTGRYDRKRAHGKGSRWVGRSAKGGTLATEGGR